MHNPIVSIVVLCKDNYIELERTLLSLVSSCSSCDSYTICIVDGSIQPLIDTGLESVLSCLKYSYHHTPDVKGIYQTMNYSLTLLNSSYLIFLYSGVEFIDSLDHIIPTLNLNFYDGVFCSSLISSSSGHDLYEYPSISVKFRRWLSFGQLPCHQSTFISLRWHFHNLYPIASVISADSIIKRSLLSSNYAFIPLVLSRFYIGGISSNVSWASLRIYLFDPSLSLLRKFIIFIRFLLYSFSGIRLLYFKNSFLNFLCSI